MPIEMVRDWLGAEINVEMLLLLSRLLHPNEAKRKIMSESDHKRVCLLDSIKVDFTSSTELISI